MALGAGWGWVNLRGRLLPPGKLSRPIPLVISIFARGFR
jgi:hypothetical protein